jgi:hypothetical protein
MLVAKWSVYVALLVPCKHRYLFALCLCPILRNSDIKAPNYANVSKYRIITLIAQRNLLEIKNQWARDDPAFVVIVLCFMSISAISFSIAFG